MFIGIVIFAILLQSFMLNTKSLEVSYYTTYLSTNVMSINNKKSNSFNGDKATICFCTLQNWLTDNISQKEISGLNI